MKRKFLDTSVQELQVNSAALAGEAKNARPKKMNMPKRKKYLFCVLLIIIYI
ncbi:hypothetical protein KKA89_01055 [Patescibacteria group bacterium]|nr:hypothetical protein [Patescibacteria group bacterium]